MKHLFRGEVMILCIVLSVLLVGALAGLGWILYLDQMIPAFQNVTIELGEAMPSISSFLTERGDPALAAMVTPLSTVDLTQTGTQQITFSQNGKEETVTLTVADTTAPVVVPRNETVQPLGTLPKAEELLESVTDLSAFTVSYAEGVTAPTDFGAALLDVVVTDASGNVTTVSCPVRYVWLQEAVTLELGTALQVTDLLMREEDADLFTDWEAIDAINSAGLGSYTVSSTYGAETCQCVVTVQDTTEPLLEVKSKIIELGATVQAEDFVVSTWDLSGDVTVELVTEPDLTLEGTQTVKITAQDASSNTATAETTLEIRYDITPPVFEGLDEMRVEIGSQPNYTARVLAADNRDGYVEFTYDASLEDTSKSGGYYVIYTATDSSGNKTTARRWVIVDHDQEDLQELVGKYADQLSDDPIEIAAWVQKNVWYASDWGNGDPVWFGFTKWKGNCYVHAYCLQAILEYKGYETQIIWTTDQSHFWVILEVEEGVWRHLDSTPGEIHTKYGLMNDYQRLDALSGDRDWDRSAWPSCD